MRYFSLFLFTLFSVILFIICIPAYLILSMKWSCDGFDIILDGKWTKLGYLQGIIGYPAWFISLKINRYKEYHKVKKEIKKNVCKVNNI